MNFEVRVEIRNQAESKNLKIIFTTKSHCFRSEIFLIPSVLNQNCLIKLVAVSISHCIILHIIKSIKAAQ